MKGPMYSNNAAQAIGFAGLRHYVGDIEAIIERCRNADDASSDLDATLIAEIWDKEPELQVAPRHQGAQIQAPLYQSKPVDSFSFEDEPRSKNSSALPAVLSVAAIVMAGIATVGLMRYLDQNQAIEPETGGLQVSEAPPSVGRGLVLNPAQIRYCIAQGIRLGAAAEHLQELPSDAAIRLQAMYVDYDGRCAEYRFQAGAFDQARRDVEPRRAALVKEGLALFKGDAEIAPDAERAKVEEQGPRLRFFQGEAPVVDDAPMREVAGMAERLQVFDRKPRKYVKDLQWRLYKLKYYHGPIDGVDSSETQKALRGFFSVHNQGAGSTDEKSIFRSVDEVYQNR